MARQILLLQRKKGFVGVTRHPSDVSTSGYYTDEESDDSYMSLDDSFAIMLDDMESDGEKIATHTVHSHTNVAFCFR